MTREQTQRSKFLGKASWKGRKQRIADWSAKVWEKISAKIPGTSAFKQQCQDFTKQRTKLYKKWIDELNSLSPEVKLRLKKRIPNHMGKLETIDALKEIFPTYLLLDTIGWFIILGLIGGVFFALTLFRPEYSWWAMILIICLGLSVLIVGSIIILVLAAIPAALIQYFTEEDFDLIWLLLITAMVLAVLGYWQGYLYSQNPVGVLGYPATEMVATWVMIVVGGLALLIVLFDILTEGPPGKPEKTGLRRLRDPDSLLLLAVGLVLVGFPIFWSSLPVHSNLLSIFNASILVGLFEVMLVNLVLGGLTIILTLFNWSFERLKLRRHPDAVLIRALFWILYDVEKYPQRWQDITFKRDILSGLERAAIVMAYISQNFRGGDAITKDWSMKEFQKKAAYLRYLKTWILTPMADTHHVFMNRIALELTNAVDGNWDALAKPEDEKVLSDYSTTRSWNSLASSVLRTSRKLVTALIPLGGVYVLQNTEFAIDPSIAGYLTVGAIIWAIVRVLEILDPQFAQTLTNVKAVQDYLPK